MAAVAAPATGEGVCTTVRTYGGIQDRSSIGEKTRVTDSPRITSGKRFFFQASHFIRRLEVLRSNLSILIPKYLAYLITMGPSKVFSFKLHSIVLQFHKIIPVFFRLIFVLCD